MAVEYLLVELGSLVNGDASAGLVGGYVKARDEID